MGLGKNEKLFIKSYPRAFTIPHTPPRLLETGTVADHQSFIPMGPAFGFLCLVDTSSQTSPRDQLVAVEVRIHGLAAFTGNVALAFLSGKLNVDGNGRCIQPGRSV